MCFETNQIWDYYTDIKFVPYQTHKYSTSTHKQNGVKLLCLTFIIARDLLTWRQPSIPRNAALMADIVVILSCYGSRLSLIFLPQDKILNDKLVDRVQCTCKCKGRDFPTMFSRQCKSTQISRNYIPSSISKHILFVQYFGCCVIDIDNTFNIYLIICIVVAICWHFAFSIISNFHSISWQLIIFLSRSYSVFVLSAYICTSVLRETKMWISNYILLRIVILPYKTWVIISLSSVLLVWKYSIGYKNYVWSNCLIEMRLQCTYKFLLFQH